MTLVLVDSINGFSFAWGHSNKQGRVLKGVKLYYRNNCLENVKYFKYLRLTLDANGKYFTAMEEFS